MSKTLEKKAEFISEVDELKKCEKEFTKMMRKGYSAFGLEWCCDDEISKSHYKLLDFSAKMLEEKYNDQGEWIDWYLSEASEKCNNVTVGNKKFSVTDAGVLFHLIEYANANN